MSGRRPRSIVAARIAALALTVSLAPQAALAQDFTNQRVTVIASPTAPVAAVRCKTGSNYWNFVFVNVVNRSRHALLGGTVEMRYYDGDGVLIGQRRDDFATNPPLASGDQVVTLLQGYNNLSEPTSAIARASCKIVAAQFTGLKKWTDTQKWGEPLVPVQQQSSQDDTGATVSGLGSTASVPAGHPQVKLAVSNAWNDTVQNALFVHCALDIQGGNSDATLTPNMLMLTMQLANGAKKSYGAMTQAAPTYQKLNPLGQTTQTAYEVDPKDDLGAIGSIIVPAHGTVHVIATFFVGMDVVADPNANRQVAFQ